MHNSHIKYEKIKSKKVGGFKFFSWSTGHGDHFEWSTIKFHHKIGSNEKKKKKHFWPDPLPFFILLKII